MEHAAALQCFQHQRLVVMAQAWADEAAFLQDLL